MSRINDKLGLKRPGTRAFMKLPDDRAQRVAVTAAQCPSCGNRGARLSAVLVGGFWCTWCNHRWVPQAVSA